MSDQLDAARSREPGPARVVLDTNVCLDLLLFGDPRVAPLAQALCARRVVAMADGDTRAEWIRVLGYPAFRLDIPRRDTLIEAFDALVEMVVDTSQRDRANTIAPPLLRCGDPDDQKFLELARDTGARWLLSRDQDLLVLAARCRRDQRFAILTPQAWAGEFGDPLTP